VRNQLRPDKVNLASLGNVVPHLHWHVIPRFRDDAHFPNPIWGTSLRQPRTGGAGNLADVLAERLGRL
jgi:diadenosine tetraphosphate (Ap4A) HIT family hydrolase